MALTPMQQARANAVNARSATKQAARKTASATAVANFKPTGIVGAVAGETAAQKFARTQANVKSAAAQTAKVANPAPGSAAAVLRANKGQVYSDNKLVADYGYGAQAEALANRYIQTKGQSFGPIARSEGQAVTPELAPYSPQPTVAPIARTPKPVASVAPIDRNIDAETAAREQIATERGIDTTKASAATLSLLNEAVNENVYGKSRPTFNKSTTVTPVATPPVVADTVTPDEVKSIVTSDSAEKYRADALANITDLQSESFDTAATGFDGLMSTDSEILDVQYAGMDAQALLEQRRTFYQDQYISLKSEISRIYSEKASDYKQQAAQQMGSTISQLASMGALGTTTAGVQYVNDVERINQAKLVSFGAEEAAALESAYNSFQEADFKNAQEMIDNAKATREEIRAVKTEMLANQQKVMELKKMERDDASQTISAMVDSGLDINTLPPGYLNYLDSKGGFVPGTSEGLWNVAQKQKAMKDITDQQAIQQASLENAAKVVSIMASLPVGQSVEIDGATYSSLNTGEVQTGTEQGADGRTYLWSYNKDTGETKTTDLGIIGSKKYTDIKSNEGAVVRVYDDGTQRLMFDPTQYNGGIAEGGLIAAFPEGTLSPFTRSKGDLADTEYVETPQWWASQCGAWVNDTTGIGVGDTYQSKVDLMDSSITSDNAQIGDVFIQPIGSSGHVGIINGKSIVNGEVVFTVSESNWKKDANGIGLITHTRPVKASEISGYARPGFKDPSYNFGTDSVGSRFTFGDSTTDPVTIDSYTQDYLHGAALSSIPADVRDKVVSSANAIRTQYASDPSIKGMQNVTGLSADVRKAYEGNIITALQNGDTEQVQTLIKSAIYDASNNETQAKLDGRRELVDALGSIQSNLSDYVARNGDTNIFKGSMEKIAKKIGEVRDPELRAIATQINTALINYRKSISGAAFTEVEGAQYEDLLPSIGNVPELNDAIISSLFSIFQGSDRSFYEARLGSTNYNSIYNAPKSGDQYQYTDRNDPDIQQFIDAGWIAETRADGTVVITAP